MPPKKKGKEEAPKKAPKAECLHPVGRRIGSNCAVCGASLAKKK